MNEFDDWYLYGESLARCLMAVTPEFGSTMFTQVTGSGASAGQPPLEAGRWYRVFKGYIYHGSEGGDNHYQRDPPAGVPPAEILDAGIVMSERLLNELDYFLSAVEKASAGQVVEMRRNDGQVSTFQATGEDLEQLRKLADMLKSTRAACRQDYNQALMFQLHANIIQHLQAAMAESGGSPKAVVELVRAGAAMVLDLRWRFAADARITALFFVNTRLCELAVREFDDGRISAHEVVRLAGMLIASLKSGNDPEQLLVQAVIDFSGAGLGNLLLELCDETLASAENAVEAALNASDLSNHAAHLYSAAHLAYAGMRLAGGFREHVAQNARPEKASDVLLEGYAGSAEELALRSGHALVVVSVNRGSGALLNLHLEQIRLAREAGDPDKAQMRADTLINDFYFYPRYYAKTLLGESA